MAFLGNIINPLKISFLEKWKSLLKGVRVVEIKLYCQSWARKKDNKNNIFHQLQLYSDICSNLGIKMCYFTIFRF